MNNNTYNIVIADDDADDQFFLKEAISKVDKTPNLISVFNGLQLLDLLHHRGNYSTTLARKPNLVLLDLNMPVMDGFNALAEIKKDTNLKDIPVYVLTTSRRENDRKTCELLGANEFYSKPSEFAKLQLLARDILNKALSSVSK